MHKIEFYVSTQKGNYLIGYHNYDNLFTEHEVNLQKLKELKIQNQTKQVTK